MEQARLILDLPMRKFIWEVIQKAEEREGHKVCVIASIIIVSVYGLMFLGHSEEL